MADIWIYVHHRDQEIEAPTYGLIVEAKRLVAESGPDGRVTAVALGALAPDLLETLGVYGVQRVLQVDHENLARYQGELFGRTLIDLVRQENPAALLMAQTPQTEDLAPRLAAALETTLVTRAMDFHLTAAGKARAIRPVANGYLFEELELERHPAPVVLFLPSVLLDIEPDGEKRVPVTPVALPGLDELTATQILKIVEAAPEELDLEEADVIVAGGRGAGKGQSFDIIHDLARAIGGSVGGTRPVIDWGTLPYERQIGQTGKYVSPRMIINCGISGANEYTAGMEKSQLVIAIDRNPRARMFRFADLGVVGDLHEILPLLISRIEDGK